jgi:hypothetical protein
MWLLMAIGYLMMIAIFDELANHYSDSGWPEKCASVRRFACYAEPAYWLIWAGVIWFFWYFRLVWGFGLWGTVLATIALVAVACLTPFFRSIVRIFPSRPEW